MTGWPHQHASAIGADEIHSLLASQLRDPATGWSLGTFGALAEFRRDPDEDCRLSEATLEAVTARGAVALRLPAVVRLLAYELPSRDGEAWSQAVILCVPEAEAAMNRRDRLTELAPDGEAPRSADRTLPLFDMGLARLQVDVCLRSDDPETLAALREGVGLNVFAPGHPLPPRLPALSPPRVFVTPVGRIEVYQHIPPPGGRSPEGPHTHVLPDLLRHGRTHAATVPVREGWVPCASFHPANPLRDALGRPRPFDSAAHAAFQAMMARFGDPELLTIKTAALEALRRGARPDDFAVPETRAGRSALRVALRQAACGGGTLEMLPRWRAAFDRPATEQPASEEGG